MLMSRTFIQLETWDKLYTHFRLVDVACRTHSGIVRRVEEIVNQVEGMRLEFRCGERGDVSPSMKSSAVSIDKLETLLLLRLRGRSRAPFFGQLGSYEFGIDVAIYQSQQMIFWNLIFERK